MIVSTRAVVLQAYPYSETSKILRLLTREHGARSAIAKGAQRPRSRYGGLLEPFTEGDATLYLKEGRDLHTLSGWDLVRSRQGIGRDLTRFAGASLLAELMLRVGTEEAEPDLYDALVREFDALSNARTESVATTVFGALWRILSQLGHGPAVELCVTCGRAFGSDEVVRWDPDAGGTACATCRPTGRPIPPEVRTELAGCFDRSTPHPVTLTLPGLHARMLAAFLQAQLGRDRPFRAVHLLTGLLADPPRTDSLEPVAEVR